MKKNQKGGTKITDDDIVKIVKVIINLPYQTMFDFLKRLHLKANYEINIEFDILDETYITKLNSSNKIIIENIIEIILICFNKKILKSVVNDIIKDHVNSNYKSVDKNFHNLTGLFDKISNF